MNLLAGSVIQGGIVFVEPGTATLNIGPGLNTAPTLDGMPATICDGDTQRGFAGIDLSWRAEGGTRCFLGAEAGYDSADSFIVDLRGGFRVPL